MIDYFVLILLFCVFFMISWLHMLRKKDDFSALAYLALFVYSIFAQIGYVYFPEFSQHLGAYFGPDLFFDYWLFMFCSFVAAFGGYLLLSRRQNYLYKMARQKRKVPLLLLCAPVLLLQLVLAVYFAINRHEFSWGRNEFTVWFGYGFRFLICSMLIFYIWQKNIDLSLFQKFFIRCILVVGILLIVIVCVAMGARSDILYLAIGIIMYELYPIVIVIKRNFLKIITIACFGLILLYVMMAMMAIRATSENVGISVLWDAMVNVDVVMGGNDIAKMLIVQDYFSPSHTLFCSMAHKIVDPLEVLRSNSANLLFGMNYPMLSTTITVKALGESFARGTGWSYHLFVEGYNALGWPGILYNAVVWNLGISIWRRIASSDDDRFNKAVLAVMSIFAVNLMRGQSVFFVKNILMFVLPSMFLLALTMGLCPGFLIHKKNAV